MLKTAIALTFVAAAMGSVPVRADEMACNEAYFHGVQSEVDKMSSAEKRELAKKEMLAARDSWTNKQMDDCMMHLRKMHDMM
jgi:hypothetical protein